MQRSIISRHPSGKVRHSVGVLSTLNSQLATRLGATIVEVLMGVLVMGVGATAVFSLFPLAVLKSLRATQMTNARLLEGNVVEILRTNPGLVEGGVPVWTPNVTGLAANDLVRTTPESGRLLSSSNMIFLAASPGNTGPLQPNFNTTSLGPTNELGVASPVTWVAIRLEDLKFAPASMALPVAAGTRNVSRYVIDPLGFLNVADPSGAAFDTASLNTRFGANDDGSLSAVADGFDLLLRHNAGITDPVIARQFFSLPDSWTMDVEAVPTSVVSGAGQLTFTFPPGTDLTGFVAVNSRMVITSAIGRGAFVYSLRGADNIGIATRNVLVVDDETLIPASLNTAAEIASIRFETYTPRYTYMLYVERRPDGGARITCPIFFNRSFNSVDERVLNLAVPVGGSDTVTVQWTRGAGLKDPVIAENRYLLDAVNGGFYQIVSADVTTTPVLGTAIITLDRALPATPDLDLTTVDSGVVVFNGIVHIFDIEL